MGTTNGYTSDCWRCSGCGAEFVLKAVYASAPDGGYILPPMPETDRERVIAEIHSHWGAKQVSKDNTRALIEEAYDAGVRTTATVKSVPDEECHCGKYGHPLGSINCSAHGRDTYTKAEIDERFVDVFDQLQGLVTAIETVGRNGTTSVLFPAGWAGHIDRLRKRFLP